MKTVSDFEPILQERIKPNSEAYEVAKLTLKAMILAGVSPYRVYIFARTGMWSGKQVRKYGL